MANPNASTANTSVAVVRKHTAFSLAADTAESTTGIIDFRAWSGGMFEVNGASTTTITWHVKIDHPSASIEPAFNSAGVAITQTVADNQVYEIPAALFGADFLYPVVNAAGTLYVSLKG